MIDYYGVLKLEKDATKSDIKFAYKRLIHKYHPDISKNSGSVDDFKLVLKAYKVLENPATRLEYDKKYLHCFLDKKTRKKILDSNLKNPESKKIKKKVKFIFSETFNKKKLNKFFNNLKKARVELRRKRFISREKSKIYINTKFDFYDKLSEMELRARMRSSNNHYVRAHAAKIIGRKKEKKFFFELMKGLSDISPIVRIEVIRAIGNIKDHRAVNFLSNAIYDYDDEVRVELSKVMRNFVDFRIVSALLKLLDDENDEVVIEAIYSLGVIGDSDISNHIRKKLKKGSLKVRKAALEVISILK